MIVHTKHRTPRKRGKTNHEYTSHKSKAVRVSYNKYRAKILIGGSHTKRLGIDIYPFAHKGVLSWLMQERPIKRSLISGVRHNILMIGTIINGPITTHQEKSKKGQPHHFVSYEDLLSVSTEEFQAKISKNLQNLQSIEVYDGVLTFLYHNSWLIDYFVKAIKSIDKYFKDSKLSIEYFNDPEEEYETLHLVVLNNLPIKDALEEEQDFFKRYFKSIYRESKGKINFRVEGR